MALGPADGIDVDDPYVRRHWVALLGPSAVADLMRLVAAARRGGTVPEPIHLSTLLRWDLVRWDSGTLSVLSPIPRVPAAALRRLNHGRRVRLGA